MCHNFLASQSCTVAYIVYHVQRLIVSNLNFGLQYLKMQKTRFIIEHINNINFQCRVVNPVGVSEPITMPQD